MLFHSWSINSHCSSILFEWKSLKKIDLKKKKKRDTIYELFDLLGISCHIRSYPIEIECKANNHWKKKNFLHYDWKIINFNENLIHSLLLISFVQQMSHEVGFVLPSISMNLVMNENWWYFERVFFVLFPLENKSSIEWSPFFLSVMPCHINVGKVTPMKEYVNDRLVCVFSLFTCRRNQREF